jgi:hypothetical protein
MHETIYHVIEASSKANAAFYAESSLDQLAQNTRFEWCKLVDGDKMKRMDTPVVAPLNSEAGKEMFNTGWEATKSSFVSSVESVAEQLDQTEPEKLMGDTIFMYNLREAGRRRGPSVKLYDPVGDGIIDPDHKDKVEAELSDQYIVAGDAKF